MRFAAGASTAVVTIAPRGDTTVEPDETVVLTVVPPAGYVAGPTPSATGTIVNDDTEVTVTATPAAVAEDAGIGMVYLVQRRGLTTSDLDVPFTLTGTATSSSDYSVSGATMSSATAGTVRIPAGADSTLVTVTPSADPTNESNETVIFTVGSGGGYLPGTAKTATGTINNDDPQATVVATTSSVFEGGTAKLVYTFSRTGSTALAVTLNFGVRGTATLGVDYTQTGAATYSSTAGSIRIPAGASSAQLLVTPVNDAVIETDETLTFDLRAGTGYFLPTTSISATGTILNDDGGGGGEGEGGGEGGEGSNAAGVDSVAANIAHSKDSDTRSAAARARVGDFVANVSTGGVQLSQSASGNRLS
ncbi:MAG TPA: Calx-beta domain-containing protein, partial [Pirellulaceae bacterium]|nr:Calx-beta domain-containing protein [Pirellulaceae bacterium]